MHQWNRYLWNVSRWTKSSLISGHFSLWQQLLRRKVLCTEKWVQLLIGFHCFCLSYKIHWWFVKVLDKMKITIYVDKICVVLEERLLKFQQPTSKDILLFQRRDTERHKSVSRKVLSQNLKLNPTQEPRKMNCVLFRDSRTGITANNSFL